MTELTARELLVHLYETAIDTTTMMGSLFPLLAIALSINLLLTAEQVPAQLAEWVSSFVSSKVTFILMVNALLLVVGCLMDMASAILILAPILIQITVVVRCLAKTRIILMQ